MNIPEGLKYSATHEWIRVLDDGSAEIGITDFAQHELGDIVFADLPSEGDTVSEGEKFADVESVKAVSDVFCPLAGTVSKVNGELLDSPGKINTDPYSAWMIRVKNPSAKKAFLSATEYAKLIAPHGGV
jgi:glycine cleavage system H protein